MVTCTDCGAIKRFVTNAEYQLWVDNPKSHDFTEDLTVSNHSGNQSNKEKTAKTNSARNANCDNTGLPFKKGENTKQANKKRKILTSELSESKVQIGCECDKAAKGEHESTYNRSDYTLADNDKIKCDTFVENNRVIRNHDVDRNSIAGVSTCTKTTAEQININDITTTEHININTNTIPTPRCIKVNNGVERKEMNEDEPEGTCC